MILTDAITALVIGVLVGVWVVGAIVRMIPHQRAAWDAQRDYELWSMPGGPFVTESQRKTYAMNARATREHEVRQFWLAAIWPLVGLYTGIRALIRMARLTITTKEDS
jgi:hypothetical protein